MNLFNKLFGSKDPASEGEVQPIGGRLTTSSGKPARMAHCDICGRDHPCEIDKDRFADIGLIVVAEYPSNLSSTYIASCELCDVDICSKCTTYVKNNAPLKHEDEARLEALRKINANFACWLSSCPKCGKALTNKSALALKRYMIFLNYLENGGDLLVFRDTDKVRARRLLRIVREDEPIFREMPGLLEMQKHLMDFVSQPPPSKMTLPQKLSLLAQGKDLLLKQEIDFLCYFDLVREIDASFTMRIARFPAVGKFAYTAEVEKTIDFSKVNSERLALVQDVSNKADKATKGEVLSLMVKTVAGTAKEEELHSLLLKQTAAFGIQLGKYPNFQKYIDLGGRNTDVSEREFATEFSEFEKDLIKSLKV